MWDAAHPSKHQMASSIPGDPRLPLPDLILAKACQVKRWARSMQRKRVADRGVRLGDPRKTDSGDVRLRYIGDTKRAAYTTWTKPRGALQQFEKLFQNFSTCGSRESIQIGCG